MKITDVRVGMRLRATQTRHNTDRFGDEIEVTALTTHVFLIDPRFYPPTYSHAVRVTVEIPAFIYRIPDDIETSGPHWAMTYAREGNISWAPLDSGGELTYEPVQSPDLTRELAERERMYW